MGGQSDERFPGVKLPFRIAGLHSPLPLLLSNRQIFQLVKEENFYTTFSAVLNTLLYTVGHNFAAKQATYDNYGFINEINTMICHD